MKEVDRVIDYCELNDKRLIPLLRVSKCCNGPYKLNHFCSLVDRILIYIWKISVMHDGLYLTSS